MKQLAATTFFGSSSSSSAPPALSTESVFDDATVAGPGAPSGATGGGAKLYSHENDTEHLDEDKARIVKEMQELTFRRLALVLKTGVELTDMQHKGLSWVVRREAVNHLGCRGGFVLDVAGVGKTLTMLGAVASEAKARRESCEHFTRQSERPPWRNIDTHATLVVCSPSVMNVWTRQVAEHFKLNSIRVLSYHGPSRRSNPNVLIKQLTEGDYDLVLTTYSIVAQEFGGGGGGSKKRKRAPSNAKSAAGEEEDESDEGEPDGTMVASGESEFYVSKGSTDEDETEEAAAEVVVAVGNPPHPTKHGQRLVPVLQSSIFLLNFRRIVLDEGHHIRNERSFTSRAVRSLRGLHRWVLTASPIHNEIDDVWSLLDFIRLRPFTVDKTQWNAAIKGVFNTNPAAGMKVFHSHVLPIAIRRTKTGLDLPPLEQRSHQLDFVPLDQAFYNAYFDYARERVKVIIDRSERLQEQRAAQRQDEEECRRSGLSISAARRKARALRGDSPDHAGLASAETHILSFLLRLRQACCSPSLVVASVKRLQDIVTVSKGGARICTEVQIREAIKRLRRAKALSGECRRCMDTRATHESDCCSVSACFGCWRAHFLGKKRANTKSVPDPPAVALSHCFECKDIIRWGDLKEVKDEDEEDDIGISDDDDDDDEAMEEEEGVSCHSTKVRWLLEEIRQRHDQEKIVVSSQWAQFLDVIAAALDADLPDIKYVRLQGNTKVSGRGRIINSFQDDPSVRICLMTSCAMSEGITLTAASRIYSMDPWWTWEREYQLNCRLHRIGQEKAVVAIAPLIKNSVEIMVHAMQLVKQAVASAAVGERGVPEKLKLVQRMKTLFRLESEGDEEQTEERPKKKKRTIPEESESESESESDSDSESDDDSLIDPSDNDEYDDEEDESEIRTLEDITNALKADEPYDDAYIKEISIKARQLTSTHAERRPSALRQAEDEEESDSGGGMNSWFVETKPSVPPPPPKKKESVVFIDITGDDDDVAEKEIKKAPWYQEWSKTPNPKPFVKRDGQLRGSLQQTSLDSFLMRKRNTKQSS